MRTFRVLSFGVVLLLTSHWSGSLVRADAVVAQQQFEAGVRAFEEQRFADAAAEFERAYAEEPAWALLFNLGSVYAALGDPVRSLHALQRYLAQGGTEVPLERRAQVELEIERQQAKIATLVVRVEPPGAEIRIDGFPVGIAPIAPLERNPGRHSVDVVLDGYRPIHTQIELTAAHHPVLELELKRIAPSAAPVADGRTGRTQRIVGFVMGGVGLVGMALSTAVLVDARYSHTDAVKLAKDGMRAKAERVESDASDNLVKGYASIGLAGALFVAGALVVFSAPAPAVSTAHLQALPWLSARAAGLSLQRRW